MLALRKTGPAFGAELVEIAAPDAPAAEEVAVDVAVAGICGSDLHAYEWTPGYGFMREVMPVTLGHEFAGRVTALGAEVDDLRIGDRVVCWPTVVCGRCPACSDGRSEECSARRIIGLHRDGAFAERVVVPARNCHRLPDSLPLDVAALVEPLAVAVHAVDVAEVAPGDRVVVQGPGPIGLLAAWVARHRGGDVLLLGLNDTVRLAAARRLGVERCADLAASPLDEAIAGAFGSKAADRVIEATGVAGSVIEGLEILRPGGVMVVAGIHAEPVKLDLTRFVRKTLQLRAAHDTTSHAFKEAIGLLSEHHAAFSAIVSHRLPLGRVAEGLDLARSRQAVKVLVYPRLEGGEE